MKHVAILLGVLLMTGASYGVTNAWTGLGGTGSWTNPANWTANTLPDFDDSDGTVSDISITNVTADLVMTLDGDKTIHSLNFASQSGRSYCITGNTLTVKSGAITRGNGPAQSTQTIYSDILFGTNAVISVYGNNNITSWLFLQGRLSDGGKGFDLLANGIRNLQLLGPIDMSGRFEMDGGLWTVRLGSNAFHSIIATTNNIAGASPGLVLTGPCSAATNLTLIDCFVTASAANLPNAAITFAGIGKLTISGTCTNPINYTGGTLTIVGSTPNILFTSDITLISNSVFFFNSSNIGQLQFAGALRDRIGGSSSLRFYSGPTRNAALTGTNTFTGSFTVDNVKLTLNGELATSRITFGSGATITGNVLIHFKNNDWIVLTNSPAVTISSMKFDLTGLTAREQIMVDYPVGTLTKPADSGLNNLLTADSVQQGWSLRNDSVNKQIIASRKSSGSFIWVR